MMSSSEYRASMHKIRESATANPVHRLDFD
jgi:hypothetical protein